MRLHPACLSLVLLVPLLAPTQMHHEDPLSPGEVDQVRELGDRPVERIKLLLKFTDERAARIAELAPDSTENDRPQQMRTALEQFTSLADELGDNMDTYDKDHADIRKALREVARVSAKWPDVMKLPAPDRDYDFERKTALDAAQDAAADARDMLAAEDAYFSIHKDEAGKNGKAPTPEP